MKKIVIVFIGLIFFTGCGGDDGFTFEEQLAIDIAKIDQYLEENNLDAEIHSSGIRFNEIDPGENLNRNIEEATEISEDLGASKFILGSIIELNEELQITATQYNTTGQLQGVAADAVTPAFDMIWLYVSVVKGGHAVPAF